MSAAFPGQPFPTPVLEDSQWFTELNTLLF